MKEHAVIGKRVTRIEGRSKATGEMKYVDDMALPGMLCGKILRSPLPHARIISIDTSRAERLVGVKAVITGKDIVQKKYGMWRRTRDQYPIAVDKVRYIGDEVAAVAAVDDATAEEALELIRVEYEKLPAVFTIEDAFRDDAPLVHEDKPKNDAGHVVFEHGNVSKGFEESDYVREDRFTALGQAHCQMEPHTALAVSDASGKLTVWSPSMSPFVKQRMLARALDMPESQIRVISPCEGGAFGGKVDMFPCDFCASLLSIKSGRPVKITYSREEVFTGTRRRHSMIMELKTGVKKDGTIVAVNCRILSDTGSAFATGLNSAYLGASGIFKVYRVPNMRYECYAIYTNTPIAGAMRGHGRVHVRFAAEQQMDMIAEALDIDPIEIRLKNALQPGELLPDTSRVTTCELSECIRRVAESSGWKEKYGKLPKNRGIGIACYNGMSSVKLSPIYCSAAIVKFNYDGAVTLHTGAVENGQGTKTMLAQIAAEELGLNVDDIKVPVADSESSPQDAGSYTMALCFVTGNAVKLAAADAKRQLLQLAAERLEAKPENLEVKDKRVYIKGKIEKGLSYNEIIAEGLINGKPIMGVGSYTPPSEYIDFWTGISRENPSYSFGAQIAEVEVDTDTGRVKVVETWAAHDGGIIINPMDSEGQLEGQVHMAQGQAMTEEYLLDNGQMMNPSLLNYRLVSPLEMPRVNSIFVQSADPEGPFGGKDVGEPLTCTGPAAIANAIYNAVGVRVNDFPMTFDKVIYALKKTTN